jgi:hypoxanthine phosphoribosyltransferase
MEFDDVSADIAHIVVKPEDIDRRLAEIAREVEGDLQGSTPLLVGVLTGAVMVMADFSRHLRVPVTIDWMALSSYGNNAHTSGTVTVVKDITADVRGHDVIIVEDIVDSGLTLSWLLGYLADRGARSVRVMTLLRKPDAMVVDVPIDYVGFDIPNDFVVGYGLDYAGRYRNLRGVGVLHPAVYSQDA